MEVLPALLAFLPRYARFSGQGVPTTARHNGVFDHREGVVNSPFDNNYNERRSRIRVYLERGKVGSCRSPLRGRLQCRLELQSLQQLLDLRSENFNFSPIVNDCIVHLNMRQCQIRVQFESRGVQFFKVLKKGF